MADKFYITTPVYYVNDVPHIGHSYTQIAADILARWKRMQASEVFFLTGTDEHGMKIATSAAEAGRTPKEHVDLMVQKFREAWEKLGISNDGFVRTTDSQHVNTVQRIFEKLYKQDDIYKGSYEGWYCPPCESYWTAFQLQGKDACPDCGRTVNKVSEQAYFLRISKYQDRLLDHINSNPGFIQPKSRRNEVIRFIESGLKDQNVSRTNFTWGVPVPFDTGHVVYVWFDALINYISAAGYLTDDVKFKKYWPADIHLMGKEIVRFHAVIWPIMLMALGLPLPKKVFGHGWWTVEGEKMSKSKGNVVDPVKLSEEVGLDAVRYLLIAEVPFGSDGDFSRQVMNARYNADLANDLGNLVSRTLTMIEKYFEGKVPVSKPPEYAEKIADAIELYEKAMDDVSLTECLSQTWKLISTANGYIETKAPWSLAKQNKTEELAAVMSNLFEILRAASVLIAPFMPETSVKMRKQLGIDQDPSKDMGLLTLLKNTTRKTTGDEAVTVKKGDALFPRMEQKAPDVK